MLNADIFNDNYNVNERDDDSDFDDLGKFYFYIFWHLSMEPKRLRDGDYEG